MHLIDVKAGVLGTSAVVGTTIANALGYAYAMKYRKKDQIVVCFLGDGATDEGVFHESLNFAALKALPMIFICENNGYAIHTRQSLRQRIANVFERAKLYGMPSERIEGNDVLEIYDRVKKTVSYLRSGQPGPFFFECMTYRWKEHVGPNEDYNLGYRTREEAEPWIKSDQVPKIGSMIPPGRRKEIEAAIEDEIQEAFRFADESPFPDYTELFTDVCMES